MKFSEFVNKLSMTEKDPILLMVVEDQPNTSYSVDNIEIDGPFVKLISKTSLQGQIIDEAHRILGLADDVEYAGGVELAELVITHFASMSSERR